jgi:hypothetical protein
VQLIFKHWTYILWPSETCFLLVLAIYLWIPEDFLHRQLCHLWREVILFFFFIVWMLFFPFPFYYWEYKFLPSDLLRGKHSFPATYDISMNALTPSVPISLRFYPKWTKSCLMPFLHLLKWRIFVSLFNRAESL